MGCGTFKKRRAAALGVALKQEDNSHKSNERYLGRCGSEKLVSNCNKSNERYLGRCGSENAVLRSLSQTTTNLYLGNAVLRNLSQTTTNLTRDNLGRCGSENLVSN